MTPEIDWNEKMQINLSLSELFLTCEALDAWEEPEDEVDWLVGVLRCTKAGLVKLTRDEIRTCALVLAGSANTNTEMDALREKFESALERDEPELRECDQCGKLTDGRWCSPACRAAGESDRG